MENQLDFKNFTKPAPIISIETEETKRQQINLFIKREDLLHDRVSGNKWRKLKYNLLQAAKENKKTLLTFGGAYSNHIAAVAEAAALFNFASIGIIRGETVTPLNATLQNAQAKGMRLIFVSRSAYRDKSTLLQELSLDVSNTYIIPEGGTNAFALQGCSEIVSHCDFANRIDYWCVACGTGGTAAGMISALETQQKLIGFSVLKGDFMKGNILDLLKSIGVERNNWSIRTDYHFGGYAKFDEDLIRFINNFKQVHEIALDPIYTGKLVFGVFDLLQKGFFPSGSNLMMVHTGGLQGITGFNERFGDLIQ